MVFLDRWRSLVSSPHDGSALSPPVAARGTGSALEIVVVFTSVRCTRIALKRAGILAKDLNARITLLVPRMVPYPLPLSEPPVQLEFIENRLRILAQESLMETTVQVYLCRDSQELLSTVLRPPSLIVIGCRRRWWPSAEARLGKQLRRAGNEVILTDKAV